MGVDEAAAACLRAASPTAEGAPPFAAERDESLVSAKRAPPEEDSLDAASESEEDSTEAAALSLVSRPLPVLTRTGIATTFSVFAPEASEMLVPPPLAPCEVALTVNGVV